MRFKFDGNKLLLLIISILIIFNIFITVKDSGIVEVRINKSLADIHSRIDSMQRTGEPIKGKDGNTPVKGIDYRDGRDGKDGKDGKDVDYAIVYSYIDNKIKSIPAPKDGKSCTTSSNNVSATIRCEDGTVSTISNGIDGLTPEVRCNDNKDRWEVRQPGQSWTVVRNLSDNSPVRCVK